MRASAVSPLRLLSGWILAAGCALAQTADGTYGPFPATPTPPPAIAVPAATPAAVATTSERATTAINSLLANVGGTGTVLVILVLVVIAVAVFLFLRRGGVEWDEMPTEPEPRHSRFEQLLAEIQGLRLRLQGGETPGYYRKIEMLARLFLERSGVVGARGMSEDEIRLMLGGGSLPQPHAQAILSIFERSRRGVEHENEKLEFSADDLLKDLLQLIRQVEGPPTTARHA